jgi:poly-gamma-glutamate synthesis protein (capsule biosynthesis protein)
VDADPPLAERAFTIVSELIAGTGLTVEAALGPTEADLVVSATPPDEGGVTFVTRYWVVAVNLPHPARGLTMAELGDIVAGRLTDWSSLTGEDRPLRLLIPADPSPPVDQWWPGTVAVGETLPMADIPAALGADPGAVTLLPLDAVDARVRGLAVDGVSVVFGAGEIGSYPLVERAWAQAHEAEDEEFALLLDEVARGLAEQLALPPPEAIILRATGDIIPARCAYARQRDYGDLRHAFLELGSWLAEADITVGSLDASLSDAGVPFGCVETFSLLAPAATVEGLALAGFDVMTVATNHVKDCGQGACGDQAFFDTLANLRGANIAPVGGGADLAEARQPAVLTVEGVRFAFLGYDEIAYYYHAGPGSPGTAPLEEAYVREDVAAARNQADVVVVLPQWGVEYTADPTLGQRALAAAAAEAGADLVIGNHPHWVQAAETIGDAFVAYALGNFVFDQDWSIPTQQGAVLEAAYHGPKLRGIEYHPIRIIDEHQPVFAGPEEAQEILDRIWTASAALD